MEKIFVVSDIHGEFVALHRNLMDRGFEFDNPNHKILSLGDMFDRGPMCDKVLEFFIMLWKQGRFMGIKGNHEDMLIQYLRGVELRQIRFNLKHNGLEKTIQQFAGQAYSQYVLWSSISTITRIINQRYPELKEFLKDLKNDYTFGAFVFTHAGMSYEKYTGIWYIDNWADTIKFIANYNTGDQIYVFGHFGAKLLNEAAGFGPTNHAEIFLTPNFIGIDATSNWTYEVNVLILEKENGEWYIDLPEDRIHPESQLKELILEE